MVPVNVVGWYRKMKLKGGAIRGRNIIVFYSSGNHSLQIDLGRQFVMTNE